MADAVSSSSLFSWVPPPTDLVITSDTILAYAEKQFRAVTVGQTAWNAFIAGVDTLVLDAKPLTRLFPVLHVPIIDAYATQIGDMVSQPPDTIKYLVALLLCYPLGLIFAQLRVPFLKHVFNLACGLFLSCIVFPTEAIHPIIASVGCYIILVVTAPIRKFVPHVAMGAPFLWMMLYLTVLHLYRLHTDYLGWSLDITGPMMILTIKLSSMGFQMFDGTDSSIKHYKSVIAKEEEKGNMKGAEIYKERISRSIGHLPNPLEFFAFAFCFTTYFAGPAFDYSEYIAAVEETNLPSSNGSKDRKWGSRVFAALSNLVMAVAFLGLNVVGSPMFAFSKVFDKNFILANTISIPALSFVVSNNWVFRMAYAYTALFLTRCKYYFAWKLTEGASNLAGFGYRPKENDWKGVCNVDLVGVETATTFVGTTLAWNQSTQKWLSRYCSQRLPRSISTTATYALSAFWHGFYPGYYMAFFSAPLVTDVAKQINKKVYPHVQKAGSFAVAVYTLLARIATGISLNYFIMPFVALAWDYGLMCWASVYYFGHVVCLLAYVVLSFIPAPRHGHHHKHDAHHANTKTKDAPVSEKKAKVA